jgi:hypothetical protein
VSGKALAAGFSAAPEPVASAIPLSYLFADPKPIGTRVSPIRLPDRICAATVVRYSHVFPLHDLPPSLGFPVAGWPVD